MRYFLEIVVFVCGACLMILEITGSRILAPFVGTSLPVWTALIGIILGFLSLGYWWGGRYADQKVEAEKLARVITLAALSVLFIAVFNQPLLKAVSTSFKNVYLSSVLGALALFALPSFLLGIVSPYAVRLKIKSLNSSGQTVGNLYAISTIGSIAGTFISGFWLIPFLGSVRILFLIAFLLIAAAYLTKKSAIILSLVLLIFLAIPQVKAFALVDTDTAYSRIWITERPDWHTGRPARHLTNSPFGIQAGVFLDADDEPVSRYFKYYRLADFFNPQIKKALTLGGGGYAQPKDFLKKHQDAQLTVVEIDPGMTKLAQKYFNLTADPRMTITHQDGRVFLNQNEQKYDAIYVDVFNSDTNLPYQLTTIETAGKIYESLNDNGVVMINLLSAIEGDHGKFFRAEYATYKKIFPQVYVFRIYPQNPNQSQNLMLAALKNPLANNLKSDNPEWQEYLNYIWNEPIADDIPVLTDDKAPVDYYALYRGR